MVTAVAALFLLAPTHVDRTVTLTPSDDVWVYPHAADPATDPFLRVWGADDKSVSPDSYHGDFSYGYIRFDLTGIAKGHLKEAHLILTHAPSQGWSLDIAAANPVEVRLLKGQFDEKSWAYEKTETVFPDGSKGGLLGQASVDKLPESGKSAIFDIDLLKGSTFDKLLDGALGKAQPHFNVAICSKVDPGALGRSSVYKFYSKDNADKSVQPTLKLVFDS